MQESYDNPGQRRGARSWLRRMGLFTSVMTVSACAMATTAFTAAAEPVGLYLAGEESAEEAKQPKFQAEKYVATISGTGPSSNLYKFQWGNVQCSGIQMSQSISSATTQMASQWIFQLGCAFNGVNSTINQNGCEFVLHVNNAGPPYAGRTDIKCPAGNAIEFRVFIAGLPKCTAVIPPQTGLEGIGFENLGAGSGRSIATTFNLSGIKYSQVEGIGIARCTAGEFENGTYTGSMQLTASK